MLDSIAANRVTVKDSIGIDSYNMTIEKEGYKIYNHIYTKDTLKLFNNNANNRPLFVKLEKNNLTSTVTDIDGNIYKTVKIGDLWWMAENLKTTRYSNGDTIRTNLSDAEWFVDSGAYAIYKNDIMNNATYGKLYNWFAVTDIRNVCPTGWHVPAGPEWQTLTLYLRNNGFGYEGSGEDIAKSLAATSGWISDSTAGNIGNDPTSNNSSGFNALPAGALDVNSIAFFGIGSYASWWSTSSAIRYDNAMNFSLSSNSNKGYLGTAHWTSGQSVRCIKDN